MVLLAPEEKHQSGAALRRKPGLARGDRRQPCWGKMHCPCNDDGCRCGEFCIACIWSTPKNPGNHALTRQNMHKLMHKHRHSFPAPVHEGSATIWHLADVLSWLHARGSYQLERS